MKFLVALYLLTVTLSLDVPATHERADDGYHARVKAHEAHITNNYRDDHKRPFNVTRAQQIKRDRERLVVLYQEQAAIARAIERTKRGKL
jgi:hypothetical protein